MVARVLEREEPGTCGRPGIGSAPPGYNYAQPVWTQHDNQWQLQRGHWNKGDRDGDGVPNPVDRAPDNPHRS